MSLPHHDLSADPHDRAALRRLDNEWLDRQWRAPGSRALVVAGTKVRWHEGRVEWHPTGEVPGGVRILLGEHDGSTRFAVVVEPESAPTGRGEWVTLRQILMSLPHRSLPDASLVLHAVGLAEWLHATRFCTWCGGRLVPAAAGHELDCPQCSKRHFPRTDPAVIMLITDGEPGTEEERCLLGRQAAWPAGRYSTLAGFCEPGETLEDAVRREVLEEVDVRVGEVSYVGNQPWPLPASLMLGFEGRALSVEITVDPREIEDARWFTRAQLAEQTAAGSLALPTGLSISRSLVERWYGAPLPGTW